MVKEGDILSTIEQIHQQDLERLKSLRYMDDDFMTVCLADNYEGGGGTDNSDNLRTGGYNN